MPFIDTENIELRRGNQFSELICSEETDPSQEIPSIIQSSRCKSTISSLLLSTFSNNNNNTIETQTQQATATTSVLAMNKKKNNFGSAKFRGLGCTAASSQQVSVPAVIRSSADWEAKRVNNNHNNKKRNNIKPKKSSSSSSSSKNSNNNGNAGKDKNALLIEGGCVDFQDLWCGPGIGFSADAAASVDCVVATRRNVGNAPRGKIDSAHRERSCVARRTVNPEAPSFFDPESEFVPERPGSEVFGARYFRHVRHPSPEGLAEIMMLQSGLIMGGRVDIHDRFRDMRLDVDGMTYEELLDLGERIGHVNTGLKEDEIGRCIRKIKLSISNEWSRTTTQADRKCSICQEEYEGNDDMGKLDCGHGFHMECIRHWLAHKNTCPVCKSEAVARPC